MLDGIDWTRQLLDGAGERGQKILDHDARRAYLAELDLVRLERHAPEHVSEKRRQAYRGARLEVSVIVVGAEAVEEPGRERRQVAGQLLEQHDGVRPGPRRDGG